MKHTTSGSAVLITGVAAMLIGASTAGAASTVSAFTPTIGVPAPGGISSGTASSPFIYATITIQTDTSRPGTTRFPSTGDVVCPCDVRWRNLTTGASGVAPARDAFHDVATGSGELTGTVVIDSAYITLVPGTAKWTVP